MYHEKLYHDIYLVHEYMKDIQLMPVYHQNYQYYRKDRKDQAL